MTSSSSSSPCGACKFLRRKCVKGCIFAPYFCHEQGATHFAAIHKVFGASNVSKLLAHLPASDRCEAAVTISYEAEARLQDPIFGCVSHIFALQQQVVNLQTQLSFMREQAAHHQSLFNNGSATENPNGKFQFYGKLMTSCSEDHHAHSDFYDLKQYSNNMSQFNSNLISMPLYYEKEGSNSINNDQNPIGCSSYEYSVNHPTDHENVSYSCSFEEASNMSSLELLQRNNKQYWGFQDADHEFQSIL